MASLVENLGDKPDDADATRDKAEMDSLPDAVKDDAVDDIDTGDDDATQQLAGKSAADDDADAGDTSEKVVNTVFDKRNAANARYDEKKRAEIAEAAGEDGQGKKPAIKDNRAKAIADTDDNTETTDDDQAGDADKGTDEGARDDAQTRTYRVNGRDVELTDEQTVEAVQKQLASETGLSEINRLKNELTGLLNEFKSRGETSPDDTDGNVDQSDRETSDPLQDKIRQTVESLQVDDSETATEKLAELVADLRNPEELVARVTENVTANTRREQAQNHYQEKFPELTDNRMAQVYTAAAAHELALADMREAGVPEKYIKAVENDAGATLQYYSQLHGQQVRSEQAGGTGFGLTGPLTLADRAAERAIADLRLRSESNDDQTQQKRREDRRSEKQTLMQQPRRQPARKTAQKPVTLEQSRKNAAREAKQHRGQAAY